RSRFGICRGVAEGEGAGWFPRLGTSRAHLWLRRCVMVKHATAPRLLRRQSRSASHTGVALASGRGKRPRILIGTASWADPGFVADWYPPKLPAKERLPWYAQHFKLVEVNSSFYAVPPAARVAKWCEQTPGD